MTNIEMPRLERDGLEDRSFGRFGRAWSHIRRHGLLEPLKLVRRHGLGASAGFVQRNIRHIIADRLARKWDRRHGVDTAGSIQLGALDVVGPHRAKGNEAVCTSPRTFDFIMKSLPCDLKKHTFIDIGSGKSRTLLLASRYPFAEIIGVEFARELVGIARNQHRAFPVSVAKMPGPQRRRGRCGGLRFPRRAPRGLFLQSLFKGCFRHRPEKSRVVARTPQAGLFHCLRKLEPPRHRLGKARHRRDRYFQGTARAGDARLPRCDPPHRLCSVSGSGRRVAMSRASRWTCAPMKARAGCRNTAPATTCTASTTTSGGTSSIARTAAAGHHGDGPTPAWATSASERTSYSPVRVRPGDDRLALHPELEVARLIELR